MAIDLQRRAAPTSQAGGAPCSANATTVAAASGAPGTCTAASGGAGIMTGAASGPAP